MNFYVEMNSTNNQEEKMIDETKNGLSKLRLLGMLKSLSIRLDEATVVASFPNRKTAQTKQGIIMYSIK